MGVSGVFCAGPKLPVLLGLDCLAMQLSFWGPLPKKQGVLVVEPSVTAKELVGIAIRAAKRAALRREDFCVMLMSCRKTAWWPFSRAFGSQEQL